MTKPRGCLLGSVEGKRTWIQNIPMILISANKWGDEEVAILRAAQRTLTVFIKRVCMCVK